MTPAPALSLEFLGRLVPGDRRPALVFVHGAGGSARMWTGQLEYFAGRSALAPFLPGHGDRGGVGCTSVADYVEAVRRGLDELGAKKIVLNGLSMGGAIAQLFALTYPDRLAGLALTSTGAKLKVMPAIFETIEKNFAQYLEMMGRFSFGKNTDPAVIRAIQDEAAGKPPALVAGDFRACDAFDVRERLGELKLPTLILAGEADLLTPPKYAEFLAERIAGSRLVRFPGAGHMLPVERPAEYNAALAGFVEELS